MKIIVGKDGQVRLPEQYIDRYKLTEGTELYLKSSEEGFTVCRPMPDIRKIYIEPTTRCNLNCITCVRNVWSDEPGDMNMETFHRIIEQLSVFAHLRAVTFGGFGEPLYHPHILEMVRQVKALDVELTISTNGVLLGELAEELVSSGVNNIIVSIDSINPQDFASIRRGASLNDVVNNIKILDDVKQRRRSVNPTIGIEFVAMRRNIHEIAILSKLANAVRAAFVVITNVLPHTKEMAKEILYDGTGELLKEIGWPVADGAWLAWGATRRPKMRWGANRHCRFVAENACVIGWDGGVSPCYALMHSYPYYIFNRKKQVTRYVLGNVRHDDLFSIWMSEEYAGFRNTVRTFDFPSCVDCGLACDIAERNEDCWLNAPSCADCLWAQDIIKCP